MSYSLPDPINDTCLGRWREHHNDELHGVLVKAFSDPKTVFLKKDDMVAIPPVTGSHHVDNSAMVRDGFVDMRGASAKQLIDNKLERRPPHYLCPLPEGADPREIRNYGTTAGEDNVEIWEPLNTFPEHGFVMVDKKTYEPLRAKYWAGYVKRRSRYHALWASVVARDEARMPLAKRSKSN